MSPVHSIPMYTAELLQSTQKTVPQLKGTAF